MKFAEIKKAVLSLNEAEQRNLVLELLPEIWSSLSGDDACIQLIKKLLDEQSVKNYQEEHMDHL